MAEGAEIHRSRSLRDILATQDHVVEIKKQFLEWLDDLEEIKRQYPDLPWRTAPEPDAGSGES